MPRVMSQSVLRNYIIVWIVNGHKVTVISRINQDYMQNSLPFCVLPRVKACKYFLMPKNVQIDWICRLQKEVTKLC